MHARDPIAESEEDYHRREGVHLAAKAELLRWFRIGGEARVRPDFYVVPQKNTVTGRMLNPTVYYPWLAHVNIQLGLSPDAPISSITNLATTLEDVPLKWYLTVYEWDLPNISHKQSDEALWLKARPLSDIRDLLKIYRVSVCVDLIIRGHDKLTNSVYSTTGPYPSWLELLP